MGGYRGVDFYISTVGLTLFVLSIVILSIEHGGEEGRILSTTGRVMVAIGLLGGFSFWFTMLADFFKNQSIENKVIWGFSLIFFWWLASLLYFFIYFLPKRKRCKTKR